VKVNLRNLKQDLLQLGWLSQSHLLKQIDDLAPNLPTAKITHLGAMLGVPLPAARVGEYRYAHRNGRTRTFKKSPHARAGLGGPLISVTATAVAEATPRATITTPRTLVSMDPSRKAVLRAIVCIAGIQECRRVVAAVQQQGS
jgi:hypothetical protein